jgi:hypothetical protein
MPKVSWVGIMLLMITLPGQGVAKRGIDVGPRLATPPEVGSLCRRYLSDSLWGITRLPCCVEQTSGIPSSSEMGAQGSLSSQLGYGAI